MKKSFLFTMIAGGVSILFLICVLIVGIKSGGFGIGAFLNSEDSEQGKWQKEYTYTWDAEELEGVEISWLNGPVSVKTGKGAYVEISESVDQTLSEKEALSLSSSENVLQIKWNSDLIPLAIFQNREKALEVVVPEELAGKLRVLHCKNDSGRIAASGFTAESCRFSSVSGDLSLSDLSGESAEFSTVSGDLSFQEITMAESFEAATVSGVLQGEKFIAPESNFSTVSGKMALSGKTDTFLASSVSAPVFASLLKCPREASLESVSGKLSLSIPENDGFQATHSSVSGRFSSDFPLKQENRETAFYKGGKASKLSFSTTSGKMELLKK